MHTMSTVVFLLQLQKSELSINFQQISFRSTFKSIDFIRRVYAYYLVINGVTSVNHWYLYSVIYFTIAFEQTPNPSNLSFEHKCNVIFTFTKINVMGILLSRSADRCSHVTHLTMQKLITNPWATDPSSPWMTAMLVMIWETKLWKQYKQHHQA